MTVRNWRNQFNYPVPAEIDDLVTRGVIEDTSWGNDVCPSFEMYRNGRGIRIWVDHPDMDSREMGSATMFTVFPLVHNGDEWETPDHALALLETDSVEEVLSFVEAFARQPWEVR